MQVHWTPSGFQIGPPSGASSATGLSPTAVTSASASTCPAGVDGQTDDGYVNAFDTVTNTQSEDQVIGYLNQATNNWIQHPNLIMNALYYEAGITASNFSDSILRFNPYIYSMYVTFHDGSSREYSFNVNQASFTPVFGSARDCSGNLIPESRRMVAGLPPLELATFYFNPSTYDFWNFYNLLVEYNIPLQGTVSGGNWTITCSLRGPSLEECY